MPRDPNDPLLLTPGPVSTSRSVKAVMMRDRASGGDELHTDLAHARAYMVGLVHGKGAYTAIPLPGSATYANEGVIAQLVPAGGKLLIHANGVYGDRLIEIVSQCTTITWVIVHCETSTDVLACRAGECTRSRQLAGCRAENFRASHLSMHVR